jgi:hypothetical protein
VIRQSALALLTLALVSALVGAADPVAPDQPEPPVRLKKKERPKPEAPTPDPRPSKPIGSKDGKERQPGDEPVPASPDLEGGLAEAFNRLSKNMQQSADRLQAKDPGEPTRQVQRAILKDLDALIEQAQQQRQQQSSGSEQQGARQERNHQSQRESAAKRRPGQDQAPRSGKPRQTSRPSTAKEPRPGAAASAARRNSTEAPNKLADLYKDIWGHLPESLRLEMDQYAREQFMAKYNELLKQYYATIAEKGRRKGE